MLTDAARQNQQWTALETGLNQQPAIVRFGPGLQALP